MTLTYNRAMAVFVVLLVAEVVWVALPGLPEYRANGLPVLIAVLVIAACRRSRRAVTALLVLWVVLALLALLASSMFVSFDDAAILLVAFGFTVAQIGALVAARARLRRA
jgi:hypothetical protein